MVSGLSAASFVRSCTLLWQYRFTASWKMDSCSSLCCHPSPSCLEHLSRWLSLHALPPGHFEIFPTSSLDQPWTSPGLAWSWTLGASWESRWSCRCCWASENYWTFKWWSWAARYVCTCFIGLSLLRLAAPSLHLLYSWFSWIFKILSSTSWELKKLLGACSQCC